MIEFCNDLQNPLWRQIHSNWYLFVDLAYLLLPDSVPQILYYLVPVVFQWGFLGGASGEEPTCQYPRCKRCRFSPWVGKSPWRRAWQPTPGFLPGESYGQRSLEGGGPLGLNKSDMTAATEHAAPHSISEAFSLAQS